MDAPSYDDLTDDEWYMIILIERLRGLSLGDIVEWLDCGLHIIEEYGNWEAFRTGEGPQYLAYKPSTGRELDYRVGCYMDATLVQGLVPLRPEVLADIFEADVEDVTACIEAWKEAVSTRERWPRCLQCTFRGSAMNPILENGLCLECNADREGWPIEMWRSNGQYAALLYSWDLLEDEVVADYIKGDGSDSGDRTETHRQVAEGRRFEMAGAA
jgi:hypothetical protein